MYHLIKSSQFKIMLLSCFLSVSCTTIKEHTLSEASPTSSPTDLPSSKQTKQEISTPTEQAVKQPTKTEKQSPTTLDMLQGKWIALNDKKSIIEFTDKLKIDY